MGQANQVYEVISHWARIPTWHTNHPADEKRFNEAVAMLRDEIGPGIEIEDVRSALYRHRDENPMLLGGKATDKEVEAFVQKTMTALGGRS